MHIWHLILMLFWSFIISYIHYDLFIDVWGFFSYNTFTNHVCWSCSVSNATWIVDRSVLAHFWIHDNRIKSAPVQELQLKCILLFNEIPCRKSWICFLSLIVRIFLSIDHHANEVELFEFELILCPKYLHITSYL